MKNTSLSCKILNQILQQLQNSGFEDNPVHVIGIYNNLIKKVHRAALRPVEKLRGLKQMQVYFQYTKKTPLAKTIPILDLLIALLDIEIEMYAYAINNKMVTFDSPDKQLPELHWTDQKSDIVELIQGLFAKGSFDNGSAQLKDIVKGISILFHIDLSNHANIFLSIRKRVGERSEYLHQLCKALDDKMDELDK